LLPIKHFEHVDGGDLGKNLQKAWKHQCRNGFFMVADVEFALEPYMKESVLERNCED
jgi:hypothetical protein